MRLWFIELLYKIADKLEREDDFVYIDLDFDDCECGCGDE